MQTFREIFMTYNEKISINFPKDLFLTLLEIIMNKNIFQFGDMHWIQLQCTAMGTPAALSFGLFKNKRILNTFSQKNVYYKRYIDDIFRIWLDTIETTWEQFKSQLNQFGNLKWNIENLTHKQHFLTFKYIYKIITITYKTP